jgi:hypothetical protein
MAKEWHLETHECHPILNISLTFRWHFVCRISFFSIVLLHVSKTTTVNSYPPRKFRRSPIHCALYRHHQNRLRKYIPLLPTTTSPRCQPNHTVTIRAAIAVPIASFTWQPTPVGINFGYAVCASAAMSRPIRRCAMRCTLERPFRSQFGSAGMNDIFFSEWHPAGPRRFSVGSTDA